MNQIETYSKVNDMPGIRAIGDAIAKSGMFGCDKPEQGVVLALQCIAENKPPLEMAKTYHLIKGKLTKRADTMLAEFMAAGGKFIFADLRDEKSQRATVTYGDYKDFKVEYTIDDAKSQGLIDGSNPNWQTRPAAMMRARLVSETLKAIAPQIVVGVYTPEEIESADRAEKAEIQKHLKQSENMHKGHEPKATKPATKPEIKTCEAVTLEDLAKPHEKAVNAYFHGKQKINEELGETWRDLPDDVQNQLLSDWESFEKSVLNGGAK